MKNFSFIVFTFFVGSLFLVPVLAIAQDPVKLAPALNKVLFENERVRVYEVNGKAGDKIPTHSHPDHVLYFVTDAKVKITDAAGKSDTLEGKAGTAIWGAATTHSSELVTAARAVVIELKK